jgi:hypothetical protein
MENEAHELYESLRGETPQQVVVSVDALTEDIALNHNPVLATLKRVSTQVKYLVDDMQELEEPRRSLVLARAYLGALWSEIPEILRSGIIEIQFDTAEVLGE